MLADWQIQNAADYGTSMRFHGLHISDFNVNQLNPASYDVTLSPMIRIPYKLDRHCRPLDVEEITNYTSLDEITTYYTLYPGEFILAASNEIITLPIGLAARVEGKSSLGRLGLAVHITAGFIDPGFHGTITLEIVNLLNRAIILRPNMRIAQIAFIPMDSVPVKSYTLTGHYQNQGLDGTPVESRYKMEG